MTQEQYDSYLQEGYTQHTSTIMYHRASVGQYVVLRKPIGTCEAVARTVGCVVFTPLACICVCVLNQQLYECSLSATEGWNGFSQKEGFVKDSAATAVLHSEDYDSVGIDTRRLDASLQAYVRGQIELGHVPIASPQYPQHAFMSFNGAKYNFSYIILIPNGKCDELAIYPVCNRQGKPCNAQEIIDNVNILCSRLEKGENTIETPTKKVPPGSLVTQYLEM